jgi:hypothetical protein
VFDAAIGYLFAIVLSQIVLEKRVQLFARLLQRSLEKAHHFAETILIRFG